MRFSPEYLRAVLPVAEPPMEYVADEVKPSLGLRAERDGEDVYRAGLWTFAMLSEIRQGRFEVSGILFGIFDIWPPFGIGVFDQEFEGAGFGLVLMSPPPMHSGIVGGIRFPE